MAKKSVKSTTSSGPAGTSGGAKREILIRVRILYLLFILIGFGVVARLIWVQMFSPSVAHNAEVLEKDIVREVVIPAHRGAILTRDGEPLAMSSMRYEPLFDFKADGFHDASTQDLERNIDSLSRMLARHFSPEDAAAEGYKYMSADEYKAIFHTEHGLGKARAKRIFPR
jgi:cell division protein FtsI (penicillin-binding protein 3)